MWMTNASLIVRRTKLTSRPLARTFWSQGRNGQAGGGGTKQQKTHHRDSSPRRPFGTKIGGSNVPNGPDEDIPSRSEQLKTLRETNQVFDILVIGGGATGCGVALDAAARNQSVVLLERADFGSETSSRSTKLIWAGIRYLATATARLLNDICKMEKPNVIWKDFSSEFNMVWSCHRERRYMIETQKHLTHWMPIAVPFTSYIWAKRRENQPPPFGNTLFQLFPCLAPIVFTFYDGMSRFTCPSSYILGSTKASSVFPELKYKNEDGQPFVRYLSVFYEAMHNDARTNLAIAMSAAKHGAVVSNYTNVVELIKKDGKVKGAVVVDQITGTEFKVYANKVVFAGGPFTDELRSMEQEATSDIMTPAVKGAAGTHIVVPGRYPMGLLDYNTSDGRFLFVLPWLNHTLIGTTDAPGPAQTRHDPPEQEIEFLIQEASRYLNKPIERQQVLSAWRGWRPLAHDPYAAEGAPASRDHVISEHPKSGVIFIAGGKWTTWREMAEEVVDRITTAPCKTLEIQLHGGGEDSDRLKSELVDSHNLDQDVALHLVETYGKYARTVASYCSEYGNDRIVPGFPYLLAEIPFACQEYACTVEDILSRRTRLAFLDIEAARNAVEPVAKVMGNTLGWSRKVQQTQIESAMDFLNSFGGPEPKK